MIRWIRRWYGANPLHLLALLAAFGLAGYAVHDVAAAGGGQWRGFAEWFAVAIIGHDLLLFPLYSLADLSLQRLLPGWVSRRQQARRPQEGMRAQGMRAQEARGPQRTQGARTAPPVLNYVRIPVLFSLLVLMAFFPLILGLSQGFYHAASGLGTQPYLWRWLGFSGAMFAVSAVAYAWRTRRALPRSRRRDSSRRPGRVPAG